MKAENWIKWDLTSRTGLKMSAFFSEHGSSGYGFFLVMVEMLYRQEGHRLSLSDESIQMYAKLCKCMQEDASAYIHTAKSLGLFLHDEAYFWSPRVLEEVEARRTKTEAISTVRSEAALTRWNKNKELPKEPDANACKPIQTDANDARLDKKRVDKIRKESIYKVFDLEDFTFGKLWGDKSKDALKRWVEFKTAAGHGKLLKSYQLEIEQFTDNPKEFVRLVDRAITQGWKGLNATVPFEVPKTNGFHKPEVQGRSQPDMFKDDMKKYPDLSPEEAAKSKALLEQVFSKIKVME